MDDRDLRFALVDLDAVASLVGSRGIPMHTSDSDVINHAAEMAAELVAAYIRCDDHDWLATRYDLVRVATSLACRLAVNPTGVGRLSFDVEGTSFSMSPGQATFSIAERLVLDRYRRRTA